MNRNGHRAKAPSADDHRVPVLYLAPWVDLGGSDKGTIDWFKHIDRSRWAPSLITTQPSPNRWLHKIEPYAEEVWCLPDLMPGVSFPGFILDFIESRGVRIVHIMNSRLGFDLLPDMSLLWHPPATVVQMHAEEPDRSGYVRYVTTRYDNFVDAYSVTSRQLKEAIRDYRIPGDAVEVIYSGVDGEQEFNPQHVEPLQLNGNGNGTPRILWPGRLVEQKDPMLTLAVLARIREQGADFVLDIVGDGELEASVRMRAEDLAIADRICWHPPSQEMARWYRSSDLLLMTSVFEGVPYVIYESLAMGVPVVAPALPGNREFMDSNSGVLVEPRNDVEKYATAITTLLADTERRHRMGLRSRERMLAEFSLAEMGRRHDALYERLLTQPRWLTHYGRLGVRPPPSTPAPQPPPTAPARPLTRQPPPERTVGVIVPCFKHGIYLDECIESIKAQTLPAVEIVVVDDASEDPETIEALARLDRDPDVTVLRQSETLGPGSARNRAIAELGEVSYVLPLDADDKLYPNAIERMVAQIEAAPPDVGFIYPNAQHIGNRSDYVPSPAYNLWLLMADNYCPSAALFDRRAFEAATYPDDMFIGHEDWAVVLHLAELGIKGEHAKGKTFMYRKAGFGSRMHQAERGLTSRETVEQRHPILDRKREMIKGRWAPAVSLVLLDDDDRAWQAGDLDEMAGQTCLDHEIIASSRLSDAVRHAESGDPSPAGRVQACIAGAKGRWVCLLTPHARAALRDPSLVERLIYSFWVHERTAAVVLAEMPSVTRFAFSQLTDEERHDARPVAVAYERPPEQSLPPIPLSVTRPLIEDVALHIQAYGPVQWRLAPSSEPRQVDASPSRNGRPPRPGTNGAGAAPSSSGPPQTALTLNRAPTPGRSERLMQRSVEWQEPLLPGFARPPGRLQRGAVWTPLKTLPLCRHRAVDREEWIVTTSRTPPDGYAIEFDLGVIQELDLAGTRRLLHDGDTFIVMDAQETPSVDPRALGHVEQAPLPMLDALELRRAHCNGAHVLVAGVDDPLYDRSEPIKTLGWIESFPIQPRGSGLHLGTWGTVPLRRYADRATWRHCYHAGSPGAGPDEVSLGSLTSETDEASIAMRLRSDGRVETDFARPSNVRRDPRLAARWVQAPLEWNEGAPPDWAQRATLSRVRHLSRRPLRRGQRRATPTTLGWLRRTRAPGYSPLFSATHPVTGDQLVTRSEVEAEDLGYRLDGLLGYIFDAGVTQASEIGATTVLWGPHFGKGRRYVEDDDKHKVG